MPDRKPLVSLVITTRDRAAVLEQCLQHVIIQGSDLGETIVVDNSVDQQTTLAVVGRFPAVTYLRADPNKRNPSLMRNMGIRASHGEVLAFIDDDTLVSPDWLKVIRNALKDPTVGGITGRVIEADAPEVCTDEIGRFSSRGVLTMNFNNTIDHVVPVEFLYGCNMAVRRSVLESIGLYDIWFGIVYEEQDLSFRIRKAGYSLQYIPGFTVQHLKAPRPALVTRRSAELDLRSQYQSCRSLVYLCVSHFGVRRDFAKVAFLNLPKGAIRSFIERPSSRTMFAISAIYIAGLVGYVMAFLRSLGFHSLPSLSDGQ